MSENSSKDLDEIPCAEAETLKRLGWRPAKGDRVWVRWDPWRFEPGAWALGICLGPAYRPEAFWPATATETQSPLRWNVQLDCGSFMQAKLDRILPAVGS